jgi:hypothetical protein
MQAWLWIAFFVISSAIGVDVFKAAMTLPLDEAVLPGLLSVPLIGLTAFGASRVARALNNREDVLK